MERHQGGEGAQRVVLKEDQLGRVERIGPPERALVRRVACGSRVPGSRWAARLLLRRERRALERLAEHAGVPRLHADSAEGAGDAHLDRSYVAGEPLSRAEVLAEDFFDNLEALVRSLHANGVCHNDLHKEQNVLVGEDGYPYLIDFQLASVHPPGAAPARRVRDDLRHVEKHRRRYTRDGRGPAAAAPRGPRRRRTATSFLWRRLAKPVYLLVTRGLLRTRDGGDERRPSSGPWPRWTGPLGPRPSFFRDSETS